MIYIAILFILFLLTGVVLSYSPKKEITKEIEESTKAVEELNNEEDLDKLEEIEEDNSGNKEGVYEKIVKQSISFYEQFKIPLTTLQLSEQDYFLLFSELVLMNNQKSQDWSNVPAYLIVNAPFGPITITVIKD